MAVPSTVSLAAIDFSHDIQRFTEGFTGREWLFKQIDNWLKHNDERFYILTGEPGVGKSAIAARLIQVSSDIVAYHFCRAGDVETVRPGRILRSLAAQLGEKLPHYGEALANTIKPIHLRVEVNIQIASMTNSQVTGVYIENLKESDPDNELDILIRAPLAELPKLYEKYQETPPKLAVLLIDSLDEAVTTTGDQNLVRLLSALSQSKSLPSWVRFILTSRPERRVLREFEPLKSHKLEEMTEDSLHDIRQYVEYRVQPPTFLQKQPKELQFDSKTFVSEVTTLSQGNFLYTKLLLNDIEAGRQSLKDLSALPKSIDEIYHNFLKRFKVNEWEDKYQPILGTLTVTQEPVTEDDLANFTGIRHTQVRQYLGVVCQFLDVVEDKEGNEIYTIYHQSLRDYLLDKKRNKDFWCNSQDYHCNIIDYYEKNSKSWKKIGQIDRYGLRHLARHLVQAERAEELHTLLALKTADHLNAWFNAKEQIGDTAGFLTDIRLAWEKANEEFEDEPTKAIELQCRYALIQASLNSLAENIPVALLVALVKKGVWTETQALAYARRVQNPEALCALAGCLPENCLPQVLEAAKEVHNRYHQALILSALAHRVPSVLDELLKIVKGIQEQLDNISRRDETEPIPAQLRELERQLASILSALPSSLPAPVKQEVLGLAKEIQIDDFRLMALRALATKWQDLIPIVLQETLALKEGYFKIKSLRVLSGALDRSLLQRVLDYVETVENKDHQALLRSILARHLSETQRLEIFHTAKAIANEAYRSEALRELALVPGLPKNLLLEIRQATSSIHHEYNHALVLSALAPSLYKEALIDKNNLIDILKYSEALNDPNEGLQSLKRFISDLPQELRLEFFDKLDLILENGNYRAEILNALIPYLPVDKFPKILTRSKGNNHILIESLAISLSSQQEIPESEERDLLSECLKIARAIQDEKSQISTLCKLPCELPVNLLQQICEMTLKIQDENDRVDALWKLTPYLSTDLLQKKALEIVDTIQDKDTQVLARSALAPYLSSEQQSSIWEAAQAIEHEYSRLVVLSTLVPELPLNERSKALDMVKKIEYDNYRLRFLSLIIPYLPKTDHFQVLEILNGIQSQFYQPELLSTLTIYLDEDAQWEILQKIAQIQDEFDRSEFLSALSSCLSSELLQQEALRIAQKIEDTCCQTLTLSALAAYLPKDQQAKVIEVAQTIDERQNRALALSRLIPYLPENEQARIIEIVEDVEDEYYRTQALKTLIPNLHKSLFPNALAIVEMIEAPEWRAEALGVLAVRLKQLSSDTLYRHWFNTLSILATRSRRELLADLEALTPVLVVLGGSESIVQLANVLLDIGQQWQ